MTAEIRFDLIQHSDAYAHALMECPESCRYMLRLYRYLEEMRPGQRLKLADAGDKERWMLVTVGEFLRSEAHWRCYELNADYTKIRRTELFPLPPVKETGLIVTL
jgi:hypothetical protein